MPLLKWLEEAEEESSEDETEVSDKEEGRKKHNVKTAGGVHEQRETGRGDGEAAGASEEQGE